MKRKYQVVMYQRIYWVKEVEIDDSDIEYSSEKEEVEEKRIDLAIQIAKEDASLDSADDGGPLKIVRVEAI